MSSFNKAYLPIINKDKTIRIIDFIITNLENKLHKTFNLIRVIPPLFDEMYSSYLLKYEDINMTNNMDLIKETKPITLFQSLSKWSQKAIQQYNIKENEGIIFIENSIWREIISSSLVSQYKKYVFIEIVVNKNSNKQKIVRDFTLEIYKIIYEISLQLEKDYQIKNFLPKTVEFIEAQLLENEFPNLDSQNKEAEVVVEKNSFILVNPGKQLFSKKFHAIRDKSIYDQKNYNEIHLLNRVDQTSVNVCSVAYKLWGNEMKNALDKYLLKDLEYEKSYSEVIKDLKTQTIEIKIDLFKLFMSLLQKGHIAEVQAGIISNEVNILSNKKMIEKI